MKTVEITLKRDLGIPERIQKDGKELSVTLSYARGYKATIQETDGDINLESNLIKINDKRRNNKNTEMAYQALEEIINQ